MGRVRNSSTGDLAPHRSGPLKQTNKKHKTGKHRSKGMLDVMTRGRVESGSSMSSRKGKSLPPRAQRKRQAAVERMKKICATLDKKKTIGGMRGAPICVALLPLTPTTNIEFMLKFVLSNVKGFGTVVGISGGTAHIKLSSGKNIMLVTPPGGSSDIWGILDTMKQADISLWLMPVLEELTPEGWTLLRMAKEQGMPTPFVGVGSSGFSKGEEKAWLKGVGKFLPVVEKIFGITNPGQVGNLMRMMGVTKMKLPKGSEMRSSMFIEECRPHHALDTSFLHPNYISAHPTDGHLNLLEVTGIIRRRNLNPYRPLLISGLGTFTLLRADITPMSVPEEFITPDQIEKEKEKEPVPQLPPRFILDPLSVPSDQVENVEVEDEEMGSDIDALSEADFDDDEMSVNSDSSQTKGKKRKVPKGTSDYQAGWLMDDDEKQPQQDILDSDDELEDEKDEKESESEDEDDDDDDDESMEVDWEEEKRQLEKMKEAKTEAEFPDWIDTPLETPAKVRFQKYRGLQSFKTSKWDANENLPKEYAKLVQFQNYKHVYKVVVKEGEDEDGPGFLPVGQRVTLLLKPVDENTAKSIGTIGSSIPVSLVSLLRHEMKMSVLNFQLNLTDVLKNKEDLIFQMGPHRFSAKAVLSEVSPGNKHKMLRYGQVNETCMATVIGPIMFPPASVIAFKTTKGELMPVGSGHLFSIDPSRLVIKRVLLSGHPFKVLTKHAVVRFMFFNREDIEWFKPIELRTRYGRRGHIKEPLGTHGHMKCIFDGKMQSQDTVLMPLYKRVFPKVNYDPSPSAVPSFTVFDSYRK